jgi:hypothetical protein
VLAIKEMGLEEVYNKCPASRPVSEANAPAMQNI